MGGVGVAGIRDGGVFEKKSARAIKRYIAGKGIVSGLGGGGPVGQRGEISAGGALRIWIGISTLASSYLSIDSDSFWRRPHLECHFFTAHLAQD